MRCLVVDDSASFRDAACRMLTRGGVDVVASATNSSEAVRLCRELQPDVVVVDVMLGSESGFDLAQQLQSSELPRRPAVVLVSTYAEQDLTEMIETSPAVGFLPKFALSVAAIEDLVATALPGR
jgi:DNA-binding NarL/FixJ family response regulator